MTRDDVKQGLEVARQRRDRAYEEATRNYTALLQMIDEAWFAEREDAITQYCREHPEESKEGWTP